MVEAIRRVFIISLIFLAPSVAIAQETQTPTAGQKQAEPGPKQPEQRPTGLPSAMDWTFNFDAGWGNFGFANSLFNNPKEPVQENLSDQWFEGFVKPALGGVYSTSAGSQFYGKISVVGERTYGSVPEAFGTDVSSFGPEDLSIGWRSGTALKGSDNLVDVVIGRTQYRLGHGFLVWDGASEGGSRGGFWTNARKAFQFAAVGKVQPGPHKIETFYLDKDELDESDSGSRVWGANYEFRSGKDDSTTLGATYMKAASNQETEIKPWRDGMNVFNARAYTAPVPTMPNLSFEFEYASERNGDAIDSQAWTLQGAYQLSDEFMWKPKIFYRYAFFEGDDPTTPANEGWDPLFLGWYDWGQWWQGEIAGEYFLSNSNLKSHEIRLHVTPNEKLSGGLMLFKFSLDHPESYGPQVTSTDVAWELDAYADWKLNSNFTVSLLGAYADPGKAVQQFADRTKNFAYGMVYLGYSF